VRPGSIFTGGGHIAAAPSISTNIATIAVSTATIAISTVTIAISTVTFTPDPTGSNTLSQ